MTFKSYALVYYSVWDRMVKMVTSTNYKNALEVDVVA